MLTWLSSRRLPVAQRVSEHVRGEPHAVKGGRACALPRRGEHRRVLPYGIDDLGCVLVVDESLCEAEEVGDRLIAERPSELSADVLGSSSKTPVPKPN